MIFKPEMFEEVLSVKADQQWLMEYVAKTANVLLREHLLTATVVYCDKDELHFSGVDEIGYTHKGYLIGLTELKKECQHDLVNGVYEEGKLIKYVCKECKSEMVFEWNFEWKVK